MSCGRFVKGVATPVGAPVDTGIENPFGKAMLTAYNTGDLTVGIIFAGVIIGDSTCRGYKARLDAAGMAQSMSRVGRCIDNGPMEGFRGILKCEMYYLQRFERYEALVTAVEDFIYFYNHRRRQRKLERLAPADY